MRALGAAALLVMAMAGSAQAQVVVRDLDRYRSPQHWAVELRFGPYSPEVDSEFDGAEDPHQTYFGTKRRLMMQLEVDYQFLHVFGSLAVGAQVGYFNETARALDAAGKPSADTTSLRLIPTALQLIYRMDEAARRLSIPLVPYAKIGLNYTIWTITDANGDVAKEAGNSGRGVTPGWQAAAGLAIMLDIIDAGASRALDAETGVNHTYIFLEAAHFDVSGLGGKKSLHVGDTTWFAGLMFEF
jgi:hypothetical protein